MATKLGLSDRYTFTGKHYIVKDGKRSLFNLDMDQTESNNLIGVYLERADQMETEYQKWLAEME